MASPEDDATVAASTQTSVRPSRKYGLGRETTLNKFGDEIVDIYVGPKETRFRVHKRTLCHRILFFDKMFNGSFKECTENSVKLPEDDPDAFDMLINWVYFRGVRDLTGIVGSDGEEVAPWDPIEFYALAEKLCLPGLQDTIMDCISKYHKNTNELPSPDFAYRAYARTSDRSRLQKYAFLGIQHVLEILLHEDTEDGWPTCEIQKLFKDHDNFARDYIDSVRTGVGEDPREMSKCEFHTHGIAEACTLEDRKRKISAQSQGQAKRQCREAEFPSPASSAASSPASATAPAS